MRSEIVRRLGARRKKVLRDKRLVASLGYPLKQRANAPETYIAPHVKRHVLPPLAPEPFPLEPVLPDAEYEHILSVISRMVQVIEYSPQAFRDMHEEHLRQHFLVQLNGQYEAQATAETFNYEGKTDILVRAEGKNIFIAECKIWNGPSGLTKALDPWLRYTCWRDTQTALLIFNRDRQMSTVLERIPKTIEAHPSHKRTCAYAAETGFRYILGHPRDSNRELTLTVLVFDVPAGDVGNLADPPPAWAISLLAPVFRLTQRSTQWPCRLRHGLQPPGWNR